MAGVAAFRMAMDGDKAMKKRLEAAATDQGMKKEIRKAVKEVGLEKLAIVQERTPVKSGKLRASERLLVMVSAKKEDIRISLVAGGPDVNYARRVHETHKTHSKFLESVILEAVPTVGRELADRIDLKRVVA